MARVLISTFVLISWLATISGVMAPEARAQNSVRADKTVSSRSDNSGKKLAIASFEPEVEKSKKAVSDSVNSIKKTVENFGQNVSDNYIPRVKNKKVTLNVPEVEIPPSLQDLCEDCIVSGQQVAKVVREHAAEFTALMAKYLKQFTDPPKLTPVSSPYDSDDRIINHSGDYLEFTKKSTNLYFTPEGRLKTVVQR